MIKRQSSGGFTVVEALVASAIVAVVALAGVAAITQMRTMKNRSIEVCRLHASSTVEKFRSIGYFSAISSFAPDRTRRDFPGDPTLSLSGIGINDSQMWPPGTNVLDDQPIPVIKNNVLIMSSLNALLAIYNSNASGFCSDTGATYGGSIAAPPPGTELKDATVMLRIRPYNTQTGELLDCPPDLRIAPEPIIPDSKPNSAFSPFTPIGGTITEPPKVTRDPSTKTNVGLKLTVMESFTNEDNQASKCNAEQNFQYPADLTPPPPPDFATVVLSSSVIPPVNSNICAPYTNSYTLQFGYATNNMEPGTVLVCRDNSVFNTYTAVDTRYAAVECRGVPTPSGVATVITKNAPPSMLPPANEPGIQFSPAYNVRKADVANPWVSCDKVTACGKPPNSGGGVAKSGTSLKPVYELRYTDLPPLCRINIEIAALDTASNPSATVLSKPNPLNPNVIDPRNTIETGFWDVPAVVCGDPVNPTTTLCSPGGSGAAGAGYYGTPSQIYFRCGGCL